MLRFHLSLRARRELSITYICKRLRVKQGMVWSSHDPSFLPLSSFSYSIEDSLDEELGVQGAETCRHMYFY